MPPTSVNKDGPVRQQQRGTYLPAGNPYLPFIAAVCAHIVVLALLVILPSITIERPPEQIITISLADMPTPIVSGDKGGSPPPKAEDKAQTKPAPPAPPPPEPVKIEATAVKKKTEPPPEPPPPPPPPPKVVSLKPTQVKKVPPPEPPPKEQPVKKKDDQAIKRELDKIREQLSKEKQRQEVNRLRQQLAQEGKLRDQHRRDQALAEARAAAEAREADAEAQRLKSQLEGLQAQSRLMEAREQGLLGPARNSRNDNVPNAASSGVDSTLMQQYLARIKGQLLSYWKLPDYKDWSASLLAKAVVTIDKSGKILDVQFEKRSGDDAFDRLVRKTLDDADPLPPIPPVLKKDRLEIGLNFTPGSITGR